MDFEDNDVYPRPDTCDCGAMFMRKGSWHTLCWECFKDTPEGVAWRRKKDASWGKRPEPPPHYEQAQKVDPDNIDMQMCRLLIQLCHPDKHDGSIGANKATQWLNNRMKNLRK